MCPNLFKQVDVPIGSLADAIIQAQESQIKPGLSKVRSVLSFRMNQYADIPFTKSEISKLAEQFMYIETGTSTSLVMICSKKKCLYKNRCPMFVNDRCPEGKECIYENKVLMDSMDRYTTDFNIEPDNYAELVMVNELVECELIVHRCNLILSLDHTDMKMESIIGVDDEGQIITKEEISHALTIKERFQARRLVLLQEFTATRREKYKKQAALKQAQDGPARMLSNMKKNVLKAKESAVIPEEVALKLNVLNQVDED
jgi:hypothetical protein